VEIVGKVGSQAKSATSTAIRFDEPLGAFDGASVTTRWITDEKLAADPGLVKTMIVKPPTGSGRVRLVEIRRPRSATLRGTDVGEIGRVAVTGIEKKGKLSQRVRIGLAAEWWSPVRSNAGARARTPAGRRRQDRKSLGSWRRRRYDAGINAHER
jgi:hypothetical protein